MNIRTDVTGLWQCSSACTVNDIHISITT